jgi:Putative transmembrane protein (PGPGW)
MIRDAARGPQDSLSRKQTGMPLGDFPSWWPTWPQVALGVGLFAVLAVASALATGWVIVRLPADYFVGPHPPPLWKGKHPLLRRVAKNVLGVVLLIGGVVMLFTPGQGVLTILLGLMLLDLPGKRRVERALVRRPGVLRFINRLRARYRRPPLEIE